MRIRYFAWLKQRTGIAEEELDPPAGLRTVADLMAYLGQRHPRFAEVAGSGGVVRCAIDQAHATPEASIIGAREIAFFPPVTGG